jgi:hypothetical protein
VLLARAVFDLGSCTRSPALPVSLNPSVSE